MTFSTNVTSTPTFTVNLTGTGVLPNSFVDFTVDNIAVLPNPTADRIEVNVGLTGNSLVSLSDANGVEVFNTSTNAQQFTIDMSVLPAGQYILCVSNGKSKWFKKVMKR
ncbi:MAG: T9SS type A sorting domain-containing protein [Cytophagales bacterium]